MEELSRYHSPEVCMLPSDCSSSSLYSFKARLPVQRNDLMKSLLPRNLTAKTIINLSSMLKKLLKTFYTVVQTFKMTGQRRFQILCLSYYIISIYIKDKEIAKKLDTVLQTVNMTGQPLFEIRSLNYYTLCFY